MWEIFVPLFLPIVCVVTTLNQIMINKQCTYKCGIRIINNEVYLKFTTMKKIDFEKQPWKLLSRVVMTTVDTVIKYIVPLLIAEHFHH